MSECWKDQAEGIIRSMIDSGTATWLAKYRVENSTILDMYKERATEFVIAELERRRA